MKFRVTAFRYVEDRQRLEFTASGVRNGVRFTVATDVKCLRDPVTPERVHMVALVRLTELFRLTPPTGRSWE